MHLFSGTLRAEKERRFISQNRERISMAVFYKNQQIGERRVDFLVDRKISVELKAIINLEAVHFAQARNF